MNTIRFCTGVLAGCGLCLTVFAGNLCYDIISRVDHFPIGYPGVPVVGNECGGACDKFFDWDYLNPGTQCRKIGSDGSQTIYCQKGVVRFDQFGVARCVRTRSPVSYIIGQPKCLQDC